MAYEVDGFFLLDSIGLTVLNWDGTIDTYVDQVRNWTMSNTEEEEEITGRGGALLKVIKRNKATEFTIENAKHMLSVWKLSTGGTLEKGVNNEGVKTEILFFDKITTTANDEVTINWTPVGTVGNEIVDLALYTANGLGKRFVQGAAVGSGIFTFDPTTKKITFDTGEVPVGTQLAIWYNRNVNAVTLNNPATSFSESRPCYLDLVAHDNCDGIFIARIEIPRGEFSGNWEASGGDTTGTSTITIRATAQTGNCPGMTFTGNNFWNLRLFNEDTPDVV